MAKTENEIIEDESDDIYRDTVDYVDLVIDGFDFYPSLISAINRGTVNLAFSKKDITKTIDEGWVAAIEHALPYLDAYMRIPSRQIKEEEQILPIELTRNISPRSIAHLGQHSDYIKEVDKHGNVTPSKLLNVYREEDALTYENKFCATLIDRLFVFVEKRYKKLTENGGDEKGNKISLDVDSVVGDTDVKMSLTIETSDKTDKKKKHDGDDSRTLMERMIHLRDITLAYKTSPFAKMIGQNFIRPPIMRTNAILKNVNLREMLTLWQFIESYDKVGYVIDAEEKAGNAKSELVNELYSLMAFQYVVFRRNTVGKVDGAMGRKQSRARKFKPKFVSELSEDGDYNVYETAPEKLLPEISRPNHRMTPEEAAIAAAIDSALKVARIR